MTPVDWLNSSPLKFGLSGGVLTVLGVLLVFLGRRGRVLDDHPICRRCEYDLTGRPESSTRCPECGAELNSMKSIRIGNRRRKGWLLWAAAAMLLVGLSAVGAAGYRFYETFDFTPYKPLSWLFDEVDAGPGAARDKAMSEIVRRVKTMGPRTGRWVVDRILQTHGEPGIAYPQRFDAILVHAIHQDWATEQQLERFLQQIGPKLGWPPSITMKSRLRRGQEVSFGLVYPYQPSPTGVPISLDYSVQSIRMGTIPLIRDPIAVASNLSLDRSVNPAVTFRPDWLRASRVPDGKQMLRMVLRMEYQVRSVRPSRPRVIDTEIAWPIELHDADAVVDNFQIDPGRRDEINKALPSVNLAVSDTGIFFLNPPSFRQLPFALAMDVWLERGREQQRIGQIRVSRYRPIVSEQLHNRTLIVFDPFPFSAGPVDVILKPSQEAADLFHRDEVIWGEEIIFRDVLPQIRPTTQPGAPVPGLGTPILQVAPTTGPRNLSQ